MPTETPERIEGLAIGDFIGVREPTKRDAIYYKIVAKDALFFDWVYENEIAANGGQVTTQTITNLNPPQNNVHQITEIELYANVLIQIEQASGFRFGTSLLDVIIGDRIFMLGNSRFVNLWIDKDHQPKATLINNTPVALSNIKVGFGGWRYLVEESKAKPAIISNATIGGFK